MSPRKGSVSATGGRMLNPSVEPAARRESAQAQLDTEGKARRDSAARSSGHVNNPSPSGSSSNLLDGGDSTASAAALEARNQRRTIGLKRFSLTDHMRDSLITALGGIARDDGMEGETTGLEKLQDIMTEAKEKGMGVSKLFQFFLLQLDTTDKQDGDLTSDQLGGANLGPEAADGNNLNKAAAEKCAKKVADVEAAAANKTGVDGPAGGVFKDTQSSKTRAEASRSTRGTIKKKSMELMPSLQKGKRPSTASSKRGSGSGASSARCRPGSQSSSVPSRSRGPIHFSATPNTRETDSSRTGKEDDPTTRAAGDAGGGAGPSNGVQWKGNVARRMSSMEEAMMRDTQITAKSFQHGLTTMGFRLTEEETNDMFQHLDLNKDKTIDLREFTRFCLEIPSMAWKAERARRGILSGADIDRELDRAAWDMANEAFHAIDANSADGDMDSEGVMAATKEPRVKLGKTIFKGEKFFWRTKDLIDVVVQLNAKEGFMAVSTFHSETLQVYPIIFVDPQKIPTNDPAIAERVKELEAKRDVQRRGPAWLGGNAQNPSDSSAKVLVMSEEDEKTVIEEKAYLDYIADYVLHRISMPDEHGNLLQPDLTQPGVEVNPDLPPESTSNNPAPEERGVSGRGDAGRDGEAGGAQNSAKAGAMAERRPGLMRTTFDEWNTLLFPNPPSRVEGAPVFSRTKRRESYFKEFQSKKGKFDEDRVKAHRLSVEAAAYSEEVSSLIRTLAPLNYSASAPALLLENSPSETDHVADAELNARPGSGRVVLEDELSKGSLSGRGSSAKNSLLESQSAPALPNPGTSAG